MLPIFNLNELNTVEMWAKRVGFELDPKDITPLRQYSIYKEFKNITLKREIFNEKNKKDKEPRYEYTEIKGDTLRDDYVTVGLLKVIMRNVNLKVVTGHCVVDFERVIASFNKRNDITYGRLIDSFINHEKTCIVINRNNNTAFAFMLMKDFEKLKADLQTKLIELEKREPVLSEESKKAYAIREQAIQDARIAQAKYEGNIVDKLKTAEKLDFLKNL